MEAHLHSTFWIVPSSYQPNISFIASWNWRDDAWLKSYTQLPDIHVHVAKWHNCTLLANHSCIFPVRTVMDTNSIVRTIIKVCLIPSAVHIIQEDWSTSRTKDAIVVLSGDCYCICKRLRNLVAVFCCFNYMYSHTPWKCNVLLFKLIWSIC